MVNSRAQDERNSKELKTLSQSPGNRYCMDCGDAGPTYTNVTVFTFVCERCSKLLAELGHRVKSIDFATFTDDEMDCLREIGNRVGRSVWLGKWSPGIYLQPDKHDTAGTKEFMRLKYIEKKWHSPEAEPEISFSGSGFQQQTSRPRSFTDFVTGKARLDTDANSANSKGSKRRTWYDGITNMLGSGSTYVQVGGAEQGDNIDQGDSFDSLDGNGPRLEVPSSASSHYQHQSHQHHDQQQPARANAKFVASVPDHFKGPDGNYRYNVKISFPDGSGKTLVKTYEEFYSFHCAMLDAFPLEAGEADPNHPRQIPYLPGKKLFFTAAAAAKRMKELDAYLTDVANVPSHIQSWGPFRQFFNLP
eukprot:Opistho-2@24494